MKRVLIAAGLYNLLWGMIAVVMPMLSWLGVSPLPTYPQFWQCIGMIVGVYGVGYLIASRDPYRHWPITLVGMLGKILGPIGFAFSIISGTLPASAESQQIDVTLGGCRVDLSLQDNLSFRVTCIV